MSGDLEPGNFYQDFAEEADELLKALVKNLLQLCESPSAPSKNAIFQEMLRGLHTLKGLAGMVGLEAAAQLSHLLESVLNRLRKELWGLSPEILEILLDSSRTLMKLVEATGADQPLPDVKARIDQLQRLLDEDSGSLSSPKERSDAKDLLASLPDGLAAHLSPDDQAKLAEAARAGRGVGVAVFEPSPEYAAQGLNVNGVREKIMAFAEIVKAVPLIVGKTVRFAFVVIFDRDTSMEEMPGVSWTDLTAEQSPLAAAPEQLPDAPALEEPAWLAPRLMSATVRVEVSRLDDIMRLVGDLVVSRWGLQNAMEEGDKGGLARSGISEGLRESAQRIERQLRDLREAVMRARMVPLSEVFGRMPLAVRDLARSSGRQVRLVLQGEETQLDKVLVERLLDPLLHLVRNSIAHGIESPSERESLGKDPIGTLTLAGSPEGDSIRITVKDDGQGLDLERIARQARKRGWLQDNAGLDHKTALEFICRAGFSTRQEAGMDAGRGVGMDVVQQTLLEMGGSLDLESKPGQGCTFSMRLPLTLAIIESFLIALGPERFAVARDSVTEVIEIIPEQISRFPQGEMMSWRGGTLPLLRLRDLLGPPQGLLASSYRNSHALVHTSPDRCVGFVVDQVVGLREVVVRAVSDPLVARPWLGGATELGDGTMALILDLPELARLASTRISRAGAQ